MFLMAIASGCSNNKSFVVKTETIQVKSLNQIVPLDDSLVRPLIYTHIHGLHKLSIKKAKAKFIAAVLPSILIVRHKIETQRNEIIKLGEKKHWTKKDSIFYFQLKSKYKATSLEALILKMKTLPNSIVLAQAAIETGWGESRFFTEANNMFGIWSYNKNESRIAAAGMRANKTIYLRSYSSIVGSIADYFEMLACMDAYSQLRNASIHTDNPFKLVSYLKNYSEQKTVYTQQLKRIIVENNLTQYDNYQIDRNYLIEAQSLDM